MLMVNAMLGSGETTKDKGKVLYFLITSLLRKEYGEKISFLKEK